jgi:hypothetical protein
MYFSGYRVEYALGNRSANLLYNVDASDLQLRHLCDSISNTYADKMGTEMTHTKRDKEMISWRYTVPPVLLSGNKRARWLSAWYQGCSGDGSPKKQGCHCQASSTKRQVLETKYGLMLVTFAVLNVL